MVEREVAVCLPCPVAPDSVLPPRIEYDDGVRVHFTTEDDREGRVTFEGLDALRVCRGEFLAYEAEGMRGDLMVVRNSRWRRERHEYEAKHYRGVFEWGDDVDTMLTDFHHYVLSFHDEFVEAIARGIWFEESDEELDPECSAEPFRELGPEDAVEDFVIHRIACQTRRTRKDEAQLLGDARYCSQPLYDLAMTLDGTTKISGSMRVRAHDGEVKSWWTNPLGTREAEIEGIATLEQTREIWDAYVAKVRQRRDEMGKMDEE